jgi:pyruvate dehydrogenase E2 component (dihydrolipoamide acetyltransferase)
MATEVLMPRLSTDVEEGVLVTWFVEPGARVAEGDLVAEIQVEKVSEEVYAPADGQIIDLRVGPGEAITQGGVIALIGAPGEALPPRPPLAAPAPTVPVPGLAAPAPPPAAAAPAPTTPAPAAVGAGAPASPAARRVARELGVDLAAVAGTGPGGRIVEDDVRRMAVPAATAAAAAAGHPLSPTRRVLADRLRTWQAATAQLTVTAEADVTALADALQAGPEGRAGSYLAAAVRACALALRDHPRLGSRWVDGRLVEPDDIDIGVAVALDTSLVAPVVRRADRKPVDGVQREVTELAGRARAGTLTIPEMHGAVFTVTNLGTYGIDAFTPLLDPPQTAILGLGRARPRPAVVDGRIEPRTLMVLSLTVDHQVTDGVPAAAFLADVVRRLEDPTGLLAAAGSADGADRAGPMTLPAAGDRSAGREEASR